LRVSCTPQGTNTRSCNQGRIHGLKSRGTNHGEREERGAERGAV